MKSILVIDTPSNCEECMVRCDGYTAKEYAQRTVIKPNWCPLKHPLKEVSSDFYIYDRRYLLDHLDREIEMLKGAKDFVKAREE